MNLSTVEDDETARTSPEVARQRAVHLSYFGIKTVLELCVGPSMYTLVNAYMWQGITTIGNDIDLRWKKYCPNAEWRIGDALKISWEGVDAVVFAPPLSKNCTGKREDSLRIDQVTPTYGQFMKRWKSLNYTPKIAVLVLPGRSLATRRDRTEYYKLVYKDLKVADGLSYITQPRLEGPRSIRKYVEIIISKYPSQLVII